MWCGSQASELRDIQRGGEDAAYRKASGATTLSYSVPVTRPHHRKSVLGRLMAHRLARAQTARTAQRVLNRLLKPKSKATTRQSNRIPNDDAIAAIGWVLTTDEVAVRLAAPERPCGNAVQEDVWSAGCCLLNDEGVTAVIGAAALDQAELPGDGERETTPAACQATHESPIG